MPDAQFTVPYPEHTHFVGREDDLARLHAALQGAGPVGINPAALGNPTGVTGQGGIGKTQLAVAYAYKYREHYPDGVYWLNAAESLWSEFANLGRHFLGQGGEGALKARLYETLRTRFKVEEVRELCLQLGINYEEFSPQLGISSLARELVEYCERRGQLTLLEAAVRRLRGDLAQPEAQDELVAHAFARLRERSQCLLILDNVADPAALDESLTGDCVPARLPGRVLFTTRRREPGRFRPVELKTLPADAALTLLLRDPRRQPLLDPAHPEHAIARDICAVFGYLPLALEIAAAHLAKFYSAPLAAYRDELRRRGALDVIVDQRVPVATRHESGLAAALAAQWATLGDEAQMLLRVAGQLSEAVYVPAARLGLLAGVPEEGQSFFDVTLAAALSELQDASLIEELAGDQARLHPLVREFACDRTPPAERVAFIAECVRRLLAAVGDIETLEQQCDRRGVDAVLYDLLATQGLLDDTAYESLRRDLQGYLRILRREAHNLRGWLRADAPSFLAQQLHLRLFNSTTPALFGNLAADLQAHRRFWTARWAARNELPGLEMTLTDHQSWGHTVAVTPDGQRAISGESNGILHVWNLDTGKAERRLTGQIDSVWRVFLTPDGRQSVFQGDKGLCYLNLDTGEIEHTLSDLPGRVMAVADGRRIITGSYEHTQHLWDLSTDNELSRVVLESDASCTIVTSGQPQQIVTGTVGGVVYVWNLETGAGVRTPINHIGKVLAVGVTPDGERVLSGSTDGALHRWDLKSRKVERMLTDHQNVMRMEITPDGQRVAYETNETNDRALHIFNLKTEKLERTIHYAVRTEWLAVTPDGQRAIFKEGEGTLRVYSLDSMDPERVSGNMSKVRALAATPDGRLAISGGEDGVLHVWNLDTGQVERMLTGHQEAVTAVALTPDGRRAVSRGRDGVHVWNLDSGDSEYVPVSDSSKHDAVAAMAHGWRIVLLYFLLDTEDGRRGALLRLYSGSDTPRLEQASSLELAQRWGEYWWRVALTSDGQKAFSFGEYGVRVWNLDSGIEERMLTCQVDRQSVVAITPDGRWAVFEGEDSTLQVWDLDTGASKRTMTGHVGVVRAVAVTSDGRRVVSGGDDWILRLWDLNTGHELGRVALGAAVECVTIVPGQPLRVIAGDRAGGVYCLEWVE